MKNELTNLNIAQLTTEIRILINESKSHVVQVASTTMTMLYWHVGKRIKEEILNDKRAEYGQNIVKNLAQILMSEYGKGFSYTALTRMIQFYEQFDNYEIVATLSQQLTWSHIIELIPIKEVNKREYYTNMCINEHWSVRALRSNIHKMLYERSSIAKYPFHETKSLIDIIKTNQELTSEIVLKDPYLLDFLGLPDEHYESDLENAILSQIEKFLLEMGVGFSFVSRQKKITIDNEHYYLDLLLYNRKLKRLIAVELKTGRFKAEYKGQMELYLAWLKKYECFEDENPPLGIILCSEKSQAQVELLEISSSNIHVAEYWSALPPLEIFQKKIQEIVIQAKRLYEDKKELEDGK